MVQLDDLKVYQSGSDPRAMLVDKEEVLYPVAVGGDVRSSVVVRKRANGQWEAAEFGRGNMVKSVVAARLGVSTRMGIAETSFLLVEIPTLAARLVGYDVNGALMLTPVYDVPGTTLHGGVTYSASDVFTVLQPLAVRINYGNQ